MEIKLPRAGYVLSLAMTVLSYPFVSRAAESVSNLYSRVAAIEISREQLRHDKERENALLYSRLSAVESQLGTKTQDRFTGQDAQLMRAQLEKQIDHLDQDVRELRSQTKPGR